MGNFERNPLSESKSPYYIENSPKKEKIKEETIHK